MHIMNLIAKMIPENEKKPVPWETGQQICCITGEKGVCFQKKQFVKKNFPNMEYFLAPNSEFVSVDAYQSLKYKWQRYSSWYCDETGFYRLDRQGVRERVINANYSNTWGGYATTSYQKQGSIVTRLNISPKAVWRFEQLDVDCSDHLKLLSIWDRLNHELREGISRPMMLTLNCSAFMLKKTGISRWLEFERWAKPLYKGAIYQFLCYLLPSQEELKNENMLNRGV